MQVILGAGGSIGRALVPHLYPHTDRVRLVARRPSSVTEHDELFPADLLDATACTRAVAGAEVAYLTVGLPYRAAVWEQQWIRLIDNVLSACATHGTRLVFFDNVYMYDPDRLDGMTETTPIRPTSRKGRVRAAVAERVREAHRTGRVKTCIARAADFYGPNLQNSLLLETVVRPLAAGKTANWLGRADVAHNFTYTPDAARAVALLGNRPDTFGDVWHLPTVAEAPTGREWVARFATALGVPPKFRTIHTTTVRLLGLFNADMRELREMLYQNNRPYRFDSSKFERTFGVEPTPYAEGIRTVVAALG